MALLLVAQATGCGSDEQAAPSAAPPRPELTVPGERPRSSKPAPDRERGSSSPDEPGPAPTSTAGEPSGGATAPAQTTTQPPDSPSNDTPPPAGSAADRFEKACRENPEACR